MQDPAAHTLPCGQNTKIKHRIPSFIQIAGGFKEKDDLRGVPTVGQKFLPETRPHPCISMAIKTCRLRDDDVKCKATSHLGAIPTALNQGTCRNHAILADPVAHWKGRRPIAGSAASVPEGGGPPRPPVSRPRGPRGHTDPTSQSLLHSQPPAGVALCWNRG